MRQVLQIAPVSDMYHKRSEVFAMMDIVIFVYDVNLHGRATLNRGVDFGQIHDKGLTRHLVQNCNQLLYSGLVAGHFVRNTPQFRLRRWFHG